MAGSNRLLHCAFSLLRLAGLVQHWLGFLAAVGEI